MTTQPQQSTDGESIDIIALCKLVWGANKDFDVEFGTDDYEYYTYMVREEHDDSYGVPLVITPLCDGKESAERTLVRILQAMAQAVRSERPMTKEEQ